MTYLWVFLRPESQRLLPLHGQEDQVVRRLDTLEVSVFLAVVGRHLCWCCCFWCWRRRRRRLEAVVTLDVSLRVFEFATLMTPFIDDTRLNLPTIGPTPFCATNALSIFALPLHAVCFLCKLQETLAAGRSPSRHAGGQCHDSWLMAHIHIFHVFAYNW